MRQNVAAVPMVVNADEMDDENFLLHFERRHADQLPGISGFLHTMAQQPELIETYRKFHDRIHNLFTPSMMEEPHEHE